MTRVDELQNELRAYQPCSDAFARTLERVAARRSRRRRRTAVAAAVLAAAGLAIGTLNPFDRGALNPLGEPSVAAATRIPLPGSIVDVTSDGDRVWALTCVEACSDEGRASIGKLVGIDARTGEILSSVDDERPFAVAAGPGGVWTIDFWGGSATRYDERSGEPIARVALELPEPVAPGDARFLPSAISVGAAGVWISTARGYVVRIDPATNRVAETLRAPADASGPILAGDDAVWIGEGTSVRRVDATTGRPARVEVKDAAGRRLAVAHLSLASGRIWATGEWARIDTDRNGHQESTLTGDAAVAEIEPNTGRVLSLASVPQGSRVEATASDALWLAVPRSSAVYEFDTRSGRIVAKANVASPNAAVPAPGRGLWVTGGARTLTLVPVRPVAQHR